MLELVELTGFDGHHPWQLSGGMQQRVVDRTRALVRAGAAADGRAVRRARRDDARAAEHRAAAHLAGDGLDGRLRHALDLRGGLPVDAGRRDVGAARARRRASSPSTCRTRARATTREDPRFFELVTQVRERSPLRRAARRDAEPRSWRRALEHIRTPVPQTLGGGRPHRARLGCRRSLVFAIGIGALAGAGRRASTSRSSCCRSRPRSATRSGTSSSALWTPGSTPSRRRSAASRSAPGSASSSPLLLRRAGGRSARALMPYAIAANAVPIIAFAPIMNDWFGLLNPFSKMAIAAVLCFFPVIVNTLRGLTSVQPASIELMHSYAAGRDRDLPAGPDPDRAAVHVHGRSRSRRVLSMIGAIVGEYFGGADQRARRADPQRLVVRRLHGRLGGDRAGQPVRDRASTRSSRSPSA